MESSRQKPAAVELRVHPPPETKMLPAVGWLLGPDLLRALKRIALAALYQEKVDPRVWMHAEPIDDFAAEPAEEEFWFDYMSDTGDAQWSMFTLASVALQEKLELETFSSDGKPIAMPRGQFLFVGGDTAYHISDELQLLERFDKPFNWAHAGGRNGAPGNGASGRVLLGIPGNHDYYDLLMGFQKQFRFSPEGGGPLALDAFKLRQSASYMGVQLPFGWQVWGLDTEHGGIDARQRRYFREMRARGCEKLIVLTSKPTTVFGRTCDDDALTRTFEQLGLPDVFRHDGEGLPPQECRLDIAGDVHHYARYWGPSQPGGASDYASVVSGLGGAFHHPSQTDFSAAGGPVRRETFPSVETSNREVADRLFLPRTRDVDHFFRGSWIWVVGGLLGALAVHSAFYNPDICSAMGWCQPDTRSPTSHGFVRSLVPVCWLVLLGAAIGFTLYLRGAFARRCKTRGKCLLSELLPPAVLLVPVVTLPVAVLLMGDARARDVIPDLAFYVQVLLCAGVLPWWAWSVGARHHGRAGKLGFLLLGLLHGWLQLATPVLLVGIGPSMATLACVAALVALAWTAYYAVKLGLRRIGLSSLLVAALAVSAFPWWQDNVGSSGRGQCWVLTVALLFAVGTLLWTIVRWRRGRKELWKPLLAFVPSAAALAAAIWFRADIPQQWAALVGGFLIGSLLSNGWLRWYLAVAHLYNGHNNEVGGACRIDSFRQFIRFRVTRDELVGYVIGIADSGATRNRKQRADSPTVEVRVIDEFHIRPRAPSATASAGPEAQPAGDDRVDRGSLDIVH